MPISLIGSFCAAAQVLGKDVDIQTLVGVRSLRAAAWLRQQGFAQAVSLAGGIDAWARQVDPAMARY